MILNRGTLGYALLAAFETCSAAPPPADTHTPSNSVAKPRKLHGRFLQITDIHPDPFYKTYSSTEGDSACHRRRGPAGLYGAETSGCDAPFSLVNETFRWIEENLKDQIDFVVWTGDSARHDNDGKIPRTQGQVVEQNQYVISKFEEVFGVGSKNGGNDGGWDGRGVLSVPIVPTFGNNDVMPHNIFLKGPNKWTSRYLDIWRNFIPEAQRHGFQQGGWFYVEVVPNKLAVFSINTLFFFDSNSGVDGCANKHEPGYEHMDWLRIQLRIMRERGMKAILMGHVPPARTKSKLSWDETCWQKFTFWQRQYRDVIVGSLFGHMNIDHFMLQDFKHLHKDTKKGRMSTAEIEGEEVRTRIQENGEVTVQSASDYLISLGDMWAKLPSPPDPTEKKHKKRKKHALSTSDSSDSSATDEEDEEPSILEWLKSKFSTSKKGKKDQDRKGEKGGKGGKDKDKAGKPKKKKSFYRRIGGPYAQRYSLSHVAPSVVPNYFPTLRVFSYNISGLEDHSISSTPYSNMDYSHNSQIPMEEDSSSDEADWLDEVERAIEANKKKKGDPRKSKKDKKYKFKIPTPPSKSSPPGPAYSNQPFTWLGYTQYFANLTYINNDFADPDSKSLEVAWFFDNETVVENGEDGQEGVHGMRWSEGKHRNHQGKKPRPKPHPKEFKYEIEYDTRREGKKGEGFALRDLTVRSILDLAGRIGRDKKNTVGKKDVDFLGDGDEGYESGEEECYEEDEEDSDDEDWDGDEDEENDEEGDEDEELEVMKKGKKDKPKKGGKGKKKPEKEHPESDGSWYTFVRRAFVSTMDARDIKENFGAVRPAAVEEHIPESAQENLEL